MRYRRLKIPGASYFFTVVTAGRRPVFADAAAVDILRQAFAQVKVRHPFDLPAIVVLPDHLHCIWTLPVDDHDYSTRWLLIKAITTRSLHALGRTGSIWQKRFWEHCIRDERDFAKHADYIHYNPVRHGLVVRAVDWQWSSIHAWMAQGLYEAGWGDCLLSFDDDVGYE